jgi:hypothetical protein
MYLYWPVYMHLMIGLNPLPLNKTSTHVRPDHVATRYSVKANRKRLALFFLVLKTSIFIRQANSFTWLANFDTRFNTYSRIYEGCLRVIRMSLLTNQFPGLDITC